MTGCRLRRQGIVCGLQTSPDVQPPVTALEADEEWRKWFADGECHGEFWDARNEEAGSNINIFCLALFLPPATHVHLPRHVRRDLHSVIQSQPFLFYVISIAFAPSRNRHAQRHLSQGTNRARRLSGRTRTRSAGLRAHVDLCLYELCHV